MKKKKNVDSVIKNVESTEKSITNFVFPAVNLKEWDGAFAVDLVAWRMS